MFLKLFPVPRKWLAPDSRVQNRVTQRGLRRSQKCPVTPKTDPLNYEPRTTRPRLPSSPEPIYPNPPSTVTSSPLATRPEHRNPGPNTTTPACTNTGRPRDKTLTVLRPARASEATPAYPELPATSQVPDPKSAATSQACTYPKGHPDLARRNGNFPGFRLFPRIPVMAPRRALPG